MGEIRSYTLDTRCFTGFPPAIGAATCRPCAGLRTPHHREMGPPGITHGVAVREGQGGNIDNSGGQAPAAASPPGRPSASQVEPRSSYTCHPYPWPVYPASIRLVK